MYSLKRINSLSIVRWFYTANLSVAIDLILFTTLTSVVGFPVYISNLISSGTAITFVYFTSGKFVFKDSTYSTGRYIIFISYFAASINFFSYIISALVDKLSLIPLIAKIITLPISFFVNYFFASKILKTQLAKYNRHTIFGLFSPLPFT